MTRFAARTSAPSRRGTRVLFVLLPTLLLGAASFLPGCTSCPPSNVAPKEYEKGKTNAEKTLYVTNDPNEAWLPFPSGTVYDFPHGLGQTPATVSTYVSFDERPFDGVTPDAVHPDHASESAGNQAVLDRWDARVVRVRNDSCTDLYVRVVIAGDSASSSLGGAGGSF